MSPLSAAARVFTLTAVILVLLACFGCQATPTTTPYEATRQKLSVAFPVNFGGARLDVVFANFRAKAGLNIVVDWPGLAQIEVRPDSLVTLHAVNLSAGRALRKLLTQLTTDRASPADASIDNDGIIYISRAGITKACFLERRVYDVADLIREDNAQTNEGRGDSSIDNSIVNAIRRYCADRWQDSAGLDFDARVIGDKLFVRASPDAYWEIDRILAALRSPPDRTPIRINEDPLDTKDAHDSTATNVRKLRTKISTNFDKTPFKDAIASIGKDTGIEFCVAWNALKEVGITENAPISLIVVQVPASRALRLMLKQLGTGDQFNPAVMTMDRGVVNISPEQDMDADPLNWRIYDISDFLTPKSTASQDNPHLDSLIDAICQFSGGPTDWVPSLETASTIVPIRNKIFVRTRSHIHRQIEKILAAFRAAPGGPPIRLDNDD